MRIFTRNGETLDPNLQHEISGQRLPAGWMLTAGADALAVFSIVETHEDDPTPPDPDPVMRAVDPVGFRALFTAAEKLAITEAGQTDPMVRMFMDDAAVAPVIDLDYPQVIQGVQYLMSKGLITPERASAVLAGEVPSEV